jgi:hypothetical protein
MPLQRDSELLCADDFPRTDCDAYKTKCSDTLERVWNRTVESAHEHLQELVLNFTEPYFQIAKVLHELYTNTSTLNGTDNLTGRAWAGRLWPKPRDWFNISIRDRACDPGEPLQEAGQHGEDGRVCHLRDEVS